MIADNPPRSAALRCTTRGGVGIWRARRCWHAMVGPSLPEPVLFCPGGCRNGLPVMGGVWQCWSGTKKLTQTERRSTMSEGKVNGQP